jgi:RNA polymerase-binding protein DksA
MGDVVVTGGSRTDLDLNYFRQRLMEEKVQAEEIVYANTQMATAGKTAITAADADDTHSMEAGTELAQRGQDAALVKNAQKILERIERALTKMQEGTYGLSDHSGKPIPVERLEAVPYATLTVQEQERFET